MDFALKSIVSFTLSCFPRRADADQQLFKPGSLATAETEQSVVS